MRFEKARFARLHVRLIHDLESGRFANITSLAKILEKKIVITTEWLFGESSSARNRPEQPHPAGPLEKISKKSSSRDTNQQFQENDPRREQCGCCVEENPQF